MTCKQIILGLRMLRVITLFVALTPLARADEPIDIGNRRELFVDRHLIERMEDGHLDLMVGGESGTIYLFHRDWLSGITHKVSFKDRTARVTSSYKRQAVSIRND